MSYFYLGGINVLPSEKSIINSIYQVIVNFRYVLFWPATIITVLGYIACFKIGGDYCFFPEGLTLLKNILQNIAAISYAYVLALWLREPSIKRKVLRYHLILLAAYLLFASFLFLGFAWILYNDIQPTWLFYFAAGLTILVFAIMPHIIHEG